MTMKLIAQEEPAIYKVLREQASVQTLGSVVSKLVDGSHNPPAKRDAGHPMLSARNIDNGSINFDEFRFISDEDFALEDRRTRVKAGDVLLTIVGTIGRAAVVPQTATPFALQRSVAVMTPTKLLPKYLAYQLQAPDVQRYFDQNARGTAQKGVYLKTLGNTPLLVTSRGAQQQTVAYLDEQLSRLDASVAALHRVQANLKRYRASVLKSACEGRLVPTEAELARQERRNFETGAQLLQRILAELPDIPPNKRKTKELSAPAVAGLPESPQGWCWATLESIARVTGGLAKSGSRVANSPMREVPYLRVANVQRGYLELSEIKTILATEKDIADLRLVPGDVLFNEGGDRDKLGRGHVWNGEVPEAIHQNHVFRARASQHHVLPQHLSMCGNGYGGDWFSEHATQSVNLASISLSTLRKFPVALPPLAEQHRIVAEADRRLSLIRVAEAQVSANLARAQRLRQSILQAAFRTPAQAGQ
jgi:type I restriction enzyme S subunit